MRGTQIAVCIINHGKGHLVRFLLLLLRDSLLLELGHVLNVTSNSDDKSGQDTTVGSSLNEIGVRRE